MLDQDRLPRTVAGIHAADLGKGDMGLIDHQQEVLGEVIEEGVGRRAGIPTL